MESSNEASGPSSPLLKKRPQVGGPRLNSTSRRPPGQTGVKDPLVQRILGAKEQRIRQLENEAASLRRQLHDSVSECRTLRALGQKQAAALGRFEDAEAQLPTLLAGHAEEVRALRQRCQKLGLEAREQARELRAKGQALHLAQEQIVQLGRLVEERGLKQRQQLQKQLDEAQDRVSELEAQVALASRQLSLEQRSNRHHLAREQRRARELQEQLTEATERLQRLDSEARTKQRRLPASHVFHRKSPAETKAASSYSDLGLSSSDEDELLQLCQQPPAQQPQAQWAVDSRTFSVRPKPVPPPPKPKLEELQEEEPREDEEEEPREDEEEGSEGDLYTKEALLKALEEIDRQQDDAHAPNGHALPVAD